MVKKKHLNKIYLYRDLIYFLTLSLFSSPPYSSFSSFHNLRVYMCVDPRVTSLDAKRGANKKTKGKHRKSHSLFVVKNKSGLKKRERYRHGAGT